MRAVKTSHSNVKPNRCSQRTPRPGRSPSARPLTCSFRRTLLIASSRQWPPERELGAYRILGPLDAGGMGEVYRALDTRLDREVAVKVLPRALAEDPERIVRLQREARLLAALNHPHIATIHGLEVAAGVHAIVMELIDGPTLAERLASGALPLGTTLEFARQIAEALEAAHEKGIVHRDLKPANIQLTATGDGESSRLWTGDDGRTALANDRNTVAGTPAYMSPEQARGDRTDARADVWAFGCVAV